MTTLDDNDHINETAMAPEDFAAEDAAAEAAAAEVAR